MDKLSDFVLQMEDLYGKGAMTFNVHQLLHLPKSMAELGPLWAHSAFIFETGNGILLKLISSANGVPAQVCERFVMKMQTMKLFNTLKMSVNTEAICSHFLGLSVAGKVESGPLGKGTVYNVEGAEKEAFQKTFATVPHTVVKFERVAVQGQQLHSVSYTRPT